MSVPPVYNAQGSQKRVLDSRESHSFFFSFFGFWRQGFPVALEAVLELALVDQAGLELTEFCLPSAGIKGLRHQHPAYLKAFKN